MILEDTTSSSYPPEGENQGPHSTRKPSSRLETVGEIYDSQEDRSSQSFWHYEGTPYDVINKTLNVVDYYKSCVSTKIRSDKELRSLYSYSVKRINTMDDEDGYLILYKGDIIQTNNNCYRVLGFIGRGSFGQTFKCRNVVTGRLVAIKVVKSIPKFYEQGKNEYLALQWISNQHPEETQFLTTLLDYTLFHYHHMFVFPLYSFSLYRFILVNCQGISFQDIRIIAREALLALAFLHRHGIIHTDVKPENMLFSNSSLDLKRNPMHLIDLGSCTNDTPRPTALCQSLYYRAPEVTLYLEYDTSIDIWSLGCVLVELYLGQPLFPGNSDLEVLSLIESCVGPIPAIMVQQSQLSSKFFVSDRYGVYHVKPLSTERELKLKSYRHL